MSKQCKIIEDMLPLYHDGVCSEESRQMVEAHLSECEECRKLLAQIDDDIIFPAKDEDVEVLKGISKAVRRGKNKALLAGILISLAVILVSFAGISAWWYFYEYNYYLAFADGQTLSSEANIKNEINPTQTYTWCDDTYQYTVSVPDFLDTGGFAGMSRLDNNEARTVELAITRWENEKYIFHVFVNDAETVRYFIVDSDLNLYGNYTEEEMANRKMELDECKDEVQKIINDAIEMWDFIA